MNYNTPPYAQFVADSSQDVRTTFIRKVFTLLFGSILTTVIAGYVASGFIQTIIPLMPIIGIATFVCFLGLLFTKQIPVVNAALFFLFAILQGAIIGPYLTILEARLPGIPAEAAWLTLSVFGALTLYVFASKKDFSFMGGFLMVAVVCLLVAGIVMFFVHAAWLSMVYSVVGVLIFAGFVLYDTSQIMLRLQPGDEMTGAISLYLDFLNLFMFILRLLTNRRD